MKYNKLLFKGIIFIIVIIVLFALLMVVFPLKLKKTLVPRVKQPNYTHITMQSWLKQDWPKALSTSQKLPNRLFYTAIMSDYLLNYQIHPDYLTLLEEFIAKNPFCPRNSLLIENAEKYLNKYPAPKVITWVEKYGLKTLEGKKNYLKALEECNNKDKKLIIKNIWHKDKTFSSHQEQEFFKTYKDYLIYEDHILRLNTLLWHKKDIQFVTNLVRKEDAQVAKCRILLQKKNAEGSSLYTKIMKQQNINPLLIHGLVYDFLRFYKDEKLTKNDRKIIIQDLTKLPIETKYVNKWTNIRICYAREMLLLRDYKLAYNLVSSNTAKVRSIPYMKANHLAGFIALMKLQEPVLALKHFNLIRKYAIYPSETSRNYYFLYLCAKDSKNLPQKALAKLYLEQASKYVATFYGQVANATLEKKEINFVIEDIAPIENLNKVQGLVEFIKILAKYKKYYLADLLLTNVFSILTKQEIAKVIQILLSESDEQNWQMMVANSSLNKNLVFADKLFPLIQLPDSIDESASPLLHAIIRKESVFNLDAISNKMAAGLMQLTQESAQFCSKKMYRKFKQCHLNPESNIILGNYYINTFFKKIYNQNLTLSLAAYHAGRENVRRWIKLLDPIKGKDNMLNTIQWIESIPFFSTQQYIQTIIRNKNMYFAMQNKGKLCIQDDLN